MTAFRPSPNHADKKHPAFRPAFFLPLTCAAVIYLSFCPVNAHAQDPEHFFETHVRPVLVEKCIGCHGDQKQSGGLRLDSREAILKGGESGAAMIPGDVSASQLIQAIRYDGDLQMPPDKELPDVQKKALIQWVEAGAVWPKNAAPLKSPKVDLAKTHWAFQPVSRPSVPAVAATDIAQIRTPIDAFILDKLNAADLTFSDVADRRTLIRRVFYALTGLPPTVEDVENFVNDPDPMAWDNLVDRLLASPTYGQHWARHWLDIARYSDTKGYVYAREERFWVHAWSYRDWVVDALNADMPYDRFLLLQMAADQVPDRKNDDLAAMGFLTLGRRFLGVKRDIIDDRIDVVCRGTMALTVACARCHDHKYDPIPTADYYSLYGVFASCRERVVPLTDSQSPDEAFDAELKKRTEALETLRQERRASTSARVRSRIGDYLQAQLELQKYPEEGFDQIFGLGDLLPAFVHRWRDYLRDAGLRNDPVFVAWHRYKAIPEEEFDQRTAAVTAALHELGPDQLHPRVSAAFATPPAAFSEVISRYTSIFQTVDAEWQAELRKYESTGTAPVAGLTDPADEQLRRLLYGPGSLCEVPDEAVIHTEYDVDSGTCNELWKLQGEVDRLIINAASEPRYATIIEDREVPSEPRIFKRGNSAEKGDDVPRRFLELLSGPARQPFEHGSGRLEMAQAIIDPANPLTARVIVNRVWAHHFGTGLVATPGDFGIRAEPPSHPELLDWLTSEFIASGWSLKALQRMIVLSAVYQQSSTGPADAPEYDRARTVDPGNRLLWRMPEHRLSFEEMRDSMLAVSGQLDLRSGGKPANLFTKPYPVRRTLYGLIDRQFLPGTLRMFDFANPDLPIPKRSETTVPQQSLFLMNHPLALERAKILATAVPGDFSVDDQIRELYRRVLQREPTGSQQAAAREFLATDAPQEEPAAPSTAADWTYGFGEYDEASQRVRGFTPLPHFTGSAWQGGEAWPDSALGWVQLTATGGHPGNDRAHAAVRRWTAPAAMTVTIQSELKHEPPAGDGIRAFIVTSRSGQLQTAKVHQHTLPLNVESLQVMPGDTIDFVVDIGDTLNSDQFLWTCSVSESASATGRLWNSRSDFPRETLAPLSPLEQLAQVLLCSNEFLFVD
ncbi:MAG: PSD1 and planctomycete cytochrome C domain-containing protein [Planctomycetaceae bacterium]